MHKTSTFDFSSSTGKGVKVAVIDSGIDITHPDIHNIYGGIGLTLGNDGTITDPDYSDTIGHGTACTGIILKKAPDVQIYGIKIFHGHHLESSPQVLIAAIRWAVDNNMQVVNLSLGISDINMSDELKEVCDYAESRNCILVSCDSNDFEDSYPAMFSNVIGVVGGKIKDADSYYYFRGNPIEFVAKGNIQRLAWINRKHIFLERNSFSAPHITGIIARILEKYPKSTIQEVKTILIENALKGDFELINSTKKSLFLMKQQFKQNTDTDRSKHWWINRACIFPFNKEMHALIRGRDLLNFTIEAIVDYIGKGLVGKDAGEVIGIGTIGLKIESNLDKALSEVDTLILGHLDALEEIKNDSIFIKILKKAIQQGKNVYHLDPAPNTSEYQALLAVATDKNLKICSSSIENFNEKYIKAALKVKIPVPVVGIFGTSSSQGKFTTQLSLRRMLLKEGYSIGQIGTEPHSELFGFDLSFPIGHNAAVKLPEKYYLGYLHYKMLEIYHKKKPDIFLVGAQSNTVPYNIDEIPTINLSSIAFLLATKPDAYILTINSMDDDDYIKRSILGMECLGQGKTICLTMSNKEKRIETIYGRSKIHYNTLDTKEHLVQMKRMEETFQIPVTDVITEEGQRKLFDTVISYFSTNA